LKIYTPFGPVIGMTKIPADMLEQFNTDCEFVTDPQRSDEYDNSKNLIAQIKSQTKFSKSMMNSKNVKWCIEKAEEFIMAAHFSPIKLRVQEAWYNRMVYPHEHNPQHIHPTAILTSVGYLKLPYNFAEAIKNNKVNGLSGGLEIFHGESSSFSYTQNTIVPGIGYYIIFGSTLRHAVYPMPDEVTEERRSFSINFVPK
jgi:hypothetical protein